MVVGLLILVGVAGAGFSSLVFIGVVADHPWLVAFYAGVFILWWLCATPRRRARKRAEADHWARMDALGREFHQQQLWLDAAIATIKANPIRPAGLERQPQQRPPTQS